MSGVCAHCGQTLPEQPRRDPPLPPLDRPALVAIHDLPEEVRASVKITREGWYDCRRIVLPAEQARDA